MFEQALEEINSSVYFTDKEVSLLDRSGVGVFTIGSHRFDYYQAVELVEKMKRLSLSVNKREIKLFNRILKSICFSFGPEFCDKHLPN